MIISIKQGTWTTRYTHTYCHCLSVFSRSPSLSICFIWITLRESRSFDKTVDFCRIPRILSSNLSVSSCAALACSEVGVSRRILYSRFCHAGNSASSAPICSSSPDDYFILICLDILSQGIGGSDDHPCMELGNEVLNQSTLLLTR